MDEGLFKMDVVMNGKIVKSIKECWYQRILSSIGLKKLKSMPKHKWSASRISEPVMIEYEKNCRDCLDIIFAPARKAMFDNFLGMYVKKNKDGTVLVSTAIKQGAHNGPRTKGKRKQRKR